MGYHARVIEPPPGVIKMSQLQPGEFGRVLEGTYAGLVVVRMSIEDRFIILNDLNNPGDWFNAEASECHIVRKFKPGEKIVLEILAGNDNDNE